MQDPTSDETLESIIASFDISPTDFDAARQRYSAVGHWLQDAEYQSGGESDIYLQGSFRLGTVIRPYRDKENSDYDIDQVCEINGGRPTPQQLKHDVGDRLKANLNYQRMLDDEGRRCWTLQYASTEGRPGFHLDVLPSRRRDVHTTQLAITHKGASGYAWRSSDPRGYYDWFKSRNVIEDATLATQRRAIYEANSHLYREVTDVPKQLVRTPLQRAVQLLKRHRDVCFDGRPYRPISIILTTICAHLYESRGILETVTRFADYVASRLDVVVGGGSLPKEGVLDYQGGRWVIENPADRSEDFADRWAATPALCASFFGWIYQLRRDIEAFGSSRHAPDLGLATTPARGSSITFGRKLLDSMSAGPVGSSGPFLSLIHQGIEGKVAWDEVREVAERNVVHESEGEARKDVAWVNFYQVKIHAGLGLTAEDRQRIQAILERHADRSDFAFCCNALLGSATGQMLRACVHDRDDGVLGWPITRLAKGQIHETSSVLVPALT